MIRFASRSLRGFTLIELMLVVAILSIIAAMSVPSVEPVVAASKLEGAAMSLQSLVARTQSEAMSSKRCTRFRFIDARTAVAEKLNVFDCDVQPSSAAKINSAEGLWIEISRIQMDEGIEGTFDPIPSETTATALGDSEPDQIRFRPSGRLFSSDTNVTDDDGVIKVTNTKMPNGLATKKVLVEAQGLICGLPRGQDPDGSGNDLDCK